MKILLLLVLAREAYVRRIMALLNTALEEQHELRNH